MSTNSTDRTNIIAHWALKEQYNFDFVVTKKNMILDYMVAIMEVAAADGILSEPERQWILGLAGAIGAPEDEMEQLQNYVPQGMNNILKLFHAESGYATGTHGVLSLIYDGFRAASADGELHPKEVEAIYALGKSLGVDEEKVKQVWDLFNEEQQFRAKRFAFIFPIEPNEVFAAIDKQY